KTPKADRRLDVLDQYRNEDTSASSMTGCNPIRLDRGFGPEDDDATRLIELPFDYLMPSLTNRDSPIPEHRRTGAIRYCVGPLKSTAAPDHAALRDRPCQNRQMGGRLQPDRALRRPGSMRVDMRPDSSVQYERSGPRRSAFRPIAAERPCSRR